MPCRIHWFVKPLLAGALALCAASATVLAAEPATQPATPTGKTPQTVQKCVRCHDETEKHSVLPIMQSKHAVMADPRTPFADRGCETCHGKSDEHWETAVNEGERRPPPQVVFKGKFASPPEEQNKVCLGCHESGLRMNWKGSQHETNSVACTSCHTLHIGKDPVLIRTTQSEVCFACHKTQRSQIYRVSTHPIRAGKMSCSQCHNPHGSMGPKLLVRPTLNETCYTCHAEKRGPFLWEHSPVRDDCSNCHTPHGSNHTPLLKARGPWLCQECHDAQFHPSTAYSGNNVPPPGGVAVSAPDRLIAKNCLNCHSQVHGSNHPSGARKTR